METNSDTLRPASFAEYQGQEPMKEELDVRITSAIVRKAPLEHVLLTAPPGMGKTSIATLIAESLCDPLLKFVCSPATTERTLAGLLRHQGVLLLDEALALTTPIPTPAGWTTIGQLSVGDEIIGGDGHPARVTRLTPVRTDSTCYKVTFDDETSIVADAGHLWLARKMSSGRKTPRIYTTQQMVDSGERFAVPRPPAVKSPEIELPVDPYLLGLWIGDGSTGQPHLNLRREDSDFIYGELQALNVKPHWISDVKTARRLSVSEIGATYGSPSSFRQRMEELDIFHSKAIPPQYLRASLDQRLALLQGLMDTDGHVDGHGFCTFVSTIPHVATAVMELVHSLGFLGHLTRQEDHRRITYKDVFKVHFTPTAELPPARLPRHLARLKAETYKWQQISIESVPSVPVRCIEVDSHDHMFLAGFGFVPTHNCHRLPRAVLESLLPALEFGFLQLPRRKVQLEFLTIIGATTEGHLLPKAIIERFPIRPRFMDYTDEDMEQILGGMLAKLGQPTEWARDLAAAAAGSPRQARSIALMARDLSIQGNTDPCRVLSMLGIEGDGLGPEHLDYLTSLDRMGGQAGLAVLGTHLRQHPAVLLDLERLLVQRGFVEYSGQGRMITEDGARRVRATIVTRGQEAPPRSLRTLST